MTHEVIVRFDALDIKDATREADPHVWLSHTMTVPRSGK